MEMSRDNHDELSVAGNADRSVEIESHLASAVQPNNFSHGGAGLVQLSGRNHPEHAVPRWDPGLPNGDTPSPHIRPNRLVQE
jgi:hypothetical protein